MNIHLERALIERGLVSLDREAFPPGGRIDRAVFWPSFGPYCFVTVRDFGEVGEVELVADGFDPPHFRFHDLGPPGSWKEARVVDAGGLAAFRVEMAEIRPEALGNVRPSYLYRDGIHFDGEVRRDGVYHDFDAHDDRDLWRDNPAQARYFLAIYRLARDLLEQDWSRRALDPRHFGDLCEREPGGERPRTRRRRS